MNNVYRIKKCCVLPFTDSKDGKQWSVRQECYAYWSLLGLRLELCSVDAIFVLQNISKKKTYQKTFLWNTCNNCLEKA